MPYRQLSGSCSDGPCPTLYIEDETGDVKAQGYITTAPTAIPAGEDVVHIPADAWARLLAGLPVKMLLRALFARFRPDRAPALPARSQ